MNHWTIWFRKVELKDGGVALPLLEFDSMAVPVSPFNGCIGPILDATGAWHIVPIDSIVRIMVAPTKPEPTP